MQEALKAHPRYSVPEETSVLWQAAREERTARAGQAERGGGLGQTSVAEEDDQLKVQPWPKRYSPMSGHLAGRRDALMAPHWSVVCLCERTPAVACGVGAAASSCP